MGKGDILARAQWLVHERGFSVIPLDHPSGTTQTDPTRIGKVPVSNWKPFQTACPTDSNLRSWFGDGPRRNIGIVTGAISGIVAIDCDSPAAIAWAHRQLPPTPMATRTARGEHLFYRRSNGGVRNKVRLRTGDPDVKMDVRGDGGYVVAPGSMHASGICYEQVGTWPPVVELPGFDLAWIAEEPRSDAPVAAPPTRGMRQVKARDRECVLPRARAYLTATPPAIQGAGGDAHTFQVVCRIVRGFDLPESDARELLLEWNQTCQPPWTERDLDEKIAGALKYGTEPLGARAEARSQDTRTRNRPSLVTATVDRGNHATPPEDRLTEAGAAERFARLHGDDVRSDHRRGHWLLWQGHRWAPDTDGAVTRLGLDFARAWQREAVDKITDSKQREAAIRAAIRLERRDALKSMLKLAADLHPIADAGDGWDPDPWLLGTPGGVVDLRTGKLRAGQRGDRITMSTDIEYRPEARSTRWEQALQSILVADETISFVQTALGYSATGDTRRDCWFLAVGSGRNGKGTIYHPVRRVLGDYAAELPAAVFDARQGAPYDLAVLPGKRFVISSEAGDTMKIHHDRIKQITGGDPMRAANKYEKSFEFQPVCKLWLAANRKPRVTDDSPAFWARVMLVPFAVSFAGREDRDLRPPLEHDPEHQAAILTWIVAGAVRYHQHGLEPPDVVTTATTEYEQDSDPLADFLAEACVLETDAAIGASDAYRHYKAWAERHGLTDRERFSATAFGRRMSDRFLHDKTRRGKVYYGLTKRDGGEV